MKTKKMFAVLLSAVLAIGSVPAFAQSSQSDMLTYSNPQELQQLLNESLEEFAEESVNDDLDEIVSEAVSNISVVDDSVYMDSGKVEFDNSYEELSETEAAKKKLEACGIDSSIVDSMNAEMIEIFSDAPVIYVNTQYAKAVETESGYEFVESTAEELAEAQSAYDYSNPIYIVEDGVSLPAETQSDDDEASLRLRNVCGVWFGIHRNGRR